MESINELFSVIIPVKGMKNEMELAKKTIPAVICMHPDELIFGVDAPQNQNIVNALNKICKKYNFNKQKFIAIEHNQTWNMPLCHIIWDCVNKSKNDKIIIINIDNMVLPSLMEGHHIIGTSNIAAHSAPGIQYAKSIRDKIKRYFHKIIMKNLILSWSGVFWIYRPYFLECMNQNDYQKIYNGMDTFIFDHIEKNEKYKYVCSREYNHKSLDYENRDLYWRQFSDGIYRYANSDRNIKLQNGLLQYLITLQRKFPTISTRFYSLIFVRPYVFKGYVWATKHKNHKIIQLAKNSSLAEWDYYGNTLINDIIDWKKIGKTGTGFKK